MIRDPHRDSSGNQTSFAFGTQVAHGRATCATLRLKFNSSGVTAPKGAVSAGPNKVRLTGTIDLAEFARLNVPDPATGKFRAGEAAAAAELQQVIGSLDRAKTARVDYIVTSGINKGKTVDFFFTADSPEAVIYLNSNFARNWPKLQKGLLEHLKKADIVPLDFRNLDPTNQAIVLKFLQGLPNDLQSKALIME